MAKMVNTESVITLKYNFRRVVFGLIFFDSRNSHTIVIELSITKIPEMVNQTGAIYPGHASAIPHAHGLQPATIS